MNEKGLVADMIRELSKAIRDIDEKDWADLVRSGFKVRIIPANRDRMGEAVHSVVDTNELTTSLRALNTKDAGMALLAEKCPTRAQLVQLAKYIDLPAEKRDSVERLRERIVDATIGYRLRSIAIRGTEQ